MIPLFDLSHQTEGIVREIEQAWSEILSSGNFVSGPRVEQFEENFAAAHQTRYAVAVANGTIALEMSMRALGVRPGDEVIVPANSFIATAAGVSNAGATPVIVDVRPETANIDVSAVRSVIGSRTVGVIGVHLYGAPFDAVELRDTCNDNGLFLVEDAAQAHLAEVSGKPVGGLGDMGTFSFYPGKNIGAPGEGGIVTTDDESLAQRLRALRNHGQTERNLSWLIGTNGRMTEMVAAVLDLKLPRLVRWNAQRREIAAVYEKLFDSMDDVQILTQPDWATSVCHVFSVEVPKRDMVRAFMADRGVETGLHYPIPIHLQEAYQGLGYSVGDLPIAERRAGRLLSVPMYPGLQMHEIEAVASAMAEALR